MEVIFSSSTGSILWHPKENVVHIEWRRYAENAPFKALLNAGLQAVIEKKSRRWLADPRKLVVIKPEDEDWYLKELVPQLTAAGRKYVAFVSDKKDALMNLSLEHVRAEVAEMTSAYFPSVEDALAWLATRPD